MSESTTRMLGEVRDAINRRMRVFLEYRDADGEATERIVWPLALGVLGNELDARRVVRAAPGLPQLPRRSHRGNARAALHVPR